MGKSPLNFRRYRGPLSWCGFGPRIRTAPDPDWIHLSPHCSSALLS